jgi:cytochrome c
MIGKSAGLLLTAMILGGPADADEAGRALFEPCRACHSLDPAAQGMAGPNLSGLIGRKVAGDPTFDYSPVLRRARDEGRVWTLEALDQFLADPEAMFPAMWMSAQGNRDAPTRNALARFIAHPASR